MRYCGVAALPAGHLQLAALEEVRTPEPPVRLSASFSGPAAAGQVARAIDGLGEAVVAIAASASSGARACDRMLQALGVPPADPAPEAGRLVELLAPRSVFAPPDGTLGQV